MKISVIDPLSPAIERTRLVLFQPFDIAKWLTLGFCAFLALLGESGAPSFSGGGGGGGGGDGLELDLDPVWDWIWENMTMIISLAAAVFVVGCLLGLVINWVGSRGKFMFIDGIVRNRGAVVEPWREYRRQGNSLFWFQLLFGLCCFIVFLIILGGCVLIAMDSIEAREFGSSAVLALAIGVPCLLVFGVTAVLIKFSLTHFVVPIMYLRRIGVLAAWDEFRFRLLPGHMGTFLLYILFQLVIGFAIGVIAVAATCLTCCLTIVPYLGTVILLPLYVFTQSYKLYFLEQFGPEWNFFGTPKGKTPPQSPFATGGAVPPIHS